MLEKENESTVFIYDKNSDNLLEISDNLNSNDEMEEFLKSQHLPELSDQSN